MKRYLLLLLLFPFFAHAQSWQKTGNALQYKVIAPLDTVWAFNLGTPTNNLLSFTPHGGGGGSGTVTTVTGVNANGFTWSIATPTTHPALTLTLQNATTSQSGQLTSVDWNTFNGKLSPTGSAAGLTGLLSSQVTTALGFTPENSANKATSFGVLNNTLYPTTQAVANYVTGAYLPLTLLGNTSVGLGSNSLDWSGNNGTWALDLLWDNTPGGSLISLQAGNSAGTNQSTLNISAQPGSEYIEMVTHVGGSTSSIHLDKATGQTQITDAIGSLGGIYTNNYTTNQRLQRLSIPSVNTVIALADSVKATISGGVAWGAITGTLSSQTDLNTALNGKQASITTGSTSQYLRGDLSLATFPTIPTASNYVANGTGLQSSSNYHISGTGKQTSSNGTISIGGTNSDFDMTNISGDTFNIHVDNATDRTILTATGGPLVLGTFGGGNIQLANQTSVGGLVFASNFVSQDNEVTTAAGTTIFDNNTYQFSRFTGASNEDVLMPDVTTLYGTGQSYTLINSSSGIISVYSSASNLIQAMASGTSMTLLANSNSDNSAAGWSVQYYTGSSGGGISALTGDVTASGTGSVATTLTTVNSNVGTFGDATHVPAITVNGKGLTTAVTSTAIAFPVTSVFGRTGAVVSATNDYTFSQIGSKPTTLGGYGITDAYPLSGNPSSFLTTNQSITFTPTGDVTGSASGSTSLTPALTIGAGKVTNAMLAGSITNANLLNSLTTINGTSIALGASGTVTAAASTLTGSTLSSAVTSSSLTAFGSSPTLNTAVLTGLPTGTGVSNSATASTLAARDANSNLYANAFHPGFTTTVSSGTPIVLTVASAQVQEITGTTAQTITLPVASTLTTGWTIIITSASSAAITIQSSGGNTVATIQNGNTATLWCVLASGTGLASWDRTVGVGSLSGTSGGGVLSTGATMNTLTLTGTTTTAAITAGASSITAGTFNNVKAGAGAAANGGISMTNSTNATAGTPNQYGLDLTWTYSAWNTTPTAAANQQQFAIEPRGINGATTGGNIFFKYQNNGGGFTDAYSFNANGNFTALTGTVILHGFTVAALPTGITGMTAYVTDALTPTFGTAVVGGGAVITPVFYNGTNWITY